MVVSDQHPAPSVFLGGLGAALLLGGLFAAGLLIVLPFQIGLVETLGEALQDAVFYIFAGMAGLFLMSAAGGAYLCLRAYNTHRKNRPTAGATHD